MELEAQKKDKEEEVTEELNIFKMQEMKMRFALFEEAWLVFFLIN